MHPWRFLQTRNKRSPSVHSDWRLYYQFLFLYNSIDSIPSPASVPLQIWTEALSLFKALERMKLCASEFCALLLPYIDSIKFNFMLIILSACYMQYEWVLLCPECCKSHLLSAIIAVLSIAWLCSDTAVTIGESKSYNRYRINHHQEESISLSYIETDRLNIWILEKQSPGTSSFPRLDFYALPSAGNFETHEFLRGNSTIQLLAIKSLALPRLSGSSCSLPCAERACTAWRRWNSIRISMEQKLPPPIASQNDCTKYRTPAWLHSVLTQPLHFETSAFVKETPRISL